MSNKSAAHSIQEMQKRIYGDVKSWNISGSIPIGARPASSIAYQNNGVASGLELDLATVDHASGSTWGNALAAHYGTKDGYWLVHRGQVDSAAQLDGLSRFALAEGSETGMRQSAPVAMLYRPFFYLLYALAGLQFKVTPKVRYYELLVSCRSVYPEWDVSAPWVVGLTNRSDPSGDDWRPGIPLKDLVERVFAGMDPTSDRRAGWKAALEDGMALALTRDTKDVFDSLWDNEGILLAKWFTSDARFAMHYDGMPQDSAHPEKCPALSEDGQYLVLPSDCAWWGLPDTAPEKGILLRSLYERAVLTAPPVQGTFAAVGELLPMKVRKGIGGEIVDANAIVQAAYCNSTIAPLLNHFVQQVFVNEIDGKVRVVNATVKPIELTPGSKLDDVWKPIFMDSPEIIEPPTEEDKKWVPITDPFDPNNPNGGSDGSDDDGEDRFKVVKTDLEAYEDLVDHPALRASGLPLLKSCGYPAYGTTERADVLLLASVLTKKGQQVDYDPEDFDTTEYKPDVDGSSIKSFTRFAFDKDKAEKALTNYLSWERETVVSERPDPSVPATETTTVAAVSFQEIAPTLKTLAGDAIPSIQLDGGKYPVALIVPTARILETFGSTQTTSRSTYLQPIRHLGGDLMRQGEKLKYSVRASGFGVCYLVEGVPTLIDDGLAGTSYAKKQVAVIGAAAESWQSAAACTKHYIDQLSLADKLDKASIEGMIQPVHESTREFPWWIIILIIVVIVIFAILGSRSSGNRAENAQPIQVIVQPNTGNEMTGTAAQGGSSVRSGGSAGSAPASQDTYSEL